MKLNDLLEGDESEVAEWLAERGLIHECTCGYTVYDVDEVIEAVHEQFGDSQCDEISDWACNLSNNFGWLFLETSDPKYDIYHCQYCNESEWGLLMDAMTISDATDSDNETSPHYESPETLIPIQTFKVFIDESYEKEFPRKPEGCFAVSAVVIPESAEAMIARKLDEILSEAYTQKPNELKYTQIAKNPRRLGKVGKAILDLINSIPACRIMSLYAPQTGYWGEKLRSIEAVAKYDKKEPDSVELRDAVSEETVENGMNSSKHRMFTTLTACVAQFLYPHRARIFFDPVQEHLDNELVEGLKDFIPRIPVKGPQFRRGDSVLTVAPGKDTERFGEDQIEFETTIPSRECPGLQLADFFAGDARIFFRETPEILSVATSDQPAINRKVLFPKMYNVNKVGMDLMEKLQNKTQNAFLPMYRHKLAHQLISYYAENGQMRHLNTMTGEIFDMVD